MRYYIKTRETESWNMSYAVEAESRDEAIQKILNCDWADVDNIDDEYIETIDREILEVEPINEEQNEY